jgi:hypothetical protein
LLDVVGWNSTVKAQGISIFNHIFFVNAYWHAAS